MPSLGNDLASIRKEQNLSIDDIHRLTKIPLETLHSIEDDSIFDNLGANKTYIRSYVRTYARTLNIDDDLIVRALNQIEQRGYQGILRDSDSDTRTFRYDDDTDHPNLEDDELDEPSTGAEEESTSTGPVPPSAKYPPQKSPTVSPDEPKTEPPSVHSVDWADMGKKINTLPSQTRLWGGLIILLLLVGAIFLIVWFQYDNDPEPVTEETTQETEPPQESAASDSLQLDLSESSGQSQQESETEASSSLPDTLQLGIYAAFDVLEPVRVQADIMDTLSPYWIEQGTVFEFEFVDNIQIRGQYEDMVILLNGHVVEDFQSDFLNDDTGVLEINREAFEDDSTYLQPPPDSLGDDIPEPENIQNQPTYNNQ